MRGMCRASGRHASGRQTSRAPCRAGSPGSRVRWAAHCWRTPAGGTPTHCPGGAQPAGQPGSRRARRLTQVSVAVRSLHRRQLPHHRLAPLPEVGTAWGHVWMRWQEAGMRRKGTAPLEAAAGSRQSARRGGARQGRAGVVGSGSGTLQATQGRAPSLSGRCPACMPAPALAHTHGSSRAAHEGPTRALSHERGGGQVVAHELAPHFAGAGLPAAQRAAGGGQPRRRPARACAAPAGREPRPAGDPPRGGMAALGDRRTYPPDPTQPHLKLNSRSSGCRPSRSSLFCRKLEANSLAEPSCTSASEKGRRRGGCRSPSDGAAAAAAEASAQQHRAASCRCLCITGVGCVIDRPGRGAGVEVGRRARALASSLRHRLALTGASADVAREWCAAGKRSKVAPPVHARLTGAAAASEIDRPARNAVRSHGSP